MCRQCCSFCDRLVAPAGCLAAGCRYLYLYDDERSGIRYMGCLHKVFKVEIDVGLFEAAEHTRAGFGGVKMTGAPLPVCRTYVERAYHGTGEAFECVNREFFQASPAAAEGGAGVAESDDQASGTFDLRDAL